MRNRLGIKIAGDVDKKNNVIRKRQNEEARGPKRAKKERKGQRGTGITGGTSETALDPYITSERPK